MNVLHLFSGNAFEFNPKIIQQTSVFNIARMIFVPESEVNLVSDKGRRVWSTSVCRLLVHEACVASLCTKLNPVVECRLLSAALAFVAEQ